MRICPWCNRYMRLHTEIKALSHWLLYYQVDSLEALRDAVEAETARERGAA